MKRTLGLLPASFIAVVCTIAPSRRSSRRQRHSQNLQRAPTASQDYIKRDVMIPMRVGVKLHTVIVVPKGAKSAPIPLTRTPYNASSAPRGITAGTCWRFCRRR